LIVALSVLSALLTAATAPAAVNCQDLSELDPTIAPSSDQLWGDLETMVGYGPRHTGHPADHRWIAYLESQMRKMGLNDVTRQPVAVNGPRPLLTTPDVQTAGLTAHHLWGFLPGSSERIIILGVHSDGQNSIEENGTIVLLRAMEYLSKVPRECRRYTFALVFVTCHMAECSSSEAGGWARNHSDIMERALAFISPEHMGQRTRSQAEILSWSLWSNTANLRAAAQRFIGELGISHVTVASSLDFGLSGLGTASAWKVASGNKPVVGGMADPFRSYIEGLVAPNIDTVNINIDRATFHKMALLFTRLAGYIDGLTPAQMQQ